MRHIEIEAIFQEFNDTLGTCSRVPARMSRQTRRPRQESLAFGLISLTALAMVFVAWPRNAEAGSIAKLVQAVGEARSIETQSSRELRPGRWLEYAHEYYEPGKWHGRIYEGTGLAVTYVVAGGRALTDFDCLDHATVEPADPKFFEEASRSIRDPLEFVRSQTDMGQVGMERKMSVRPNPPINGRPSYSITLDRKEDSFHAEITVDQQTNLPYQSKVTVRGPSNQGMLHYRMQYLFNQDLPPSLFALQSAKPTIDVPSAQVELEATWKKPLAEIGSTDVRDACITSDGTVWIAVTNDERETTILPTALKTESETAYTRLGNDIVPSAILGKSHPFKLNGKQIYMVGFAPLSEPRVPPSRVKVEFAARGAQLPGFRQGPPKRLRAESTVSLSLRKEPGRLPSYFPTLDLDDFSIQIPIEIDDAKANALEKQGRMIEAAHAYEQSAIDYRSFVKYVGYKSLQSAAECYKKAGLNQKAAEDLLMAKALKDSRER
jgi:hypothetical protein